MEIDLSNDTSLSENYPWYFFPSCSGTDKNAD